MQQLASFDAAILWPNDLHQRTFHEVYRILVMQNSRWNKDGHDILVVIITFKHGFVTHLAQLYLLTAAWNGRPRIGVECSCHGHACYLHGCVADVNSSGMNLPLLMPDAESLFRSQKMSNWGYASYGGRLVPRLRGNARTWPIRVEV